MDRDIGARGDRQGLCAKVAVFALADNAVHTRLVRPVDVMQPNGHNRIARFGDLVRFHIPRAGSLGKRIHSLLQGLIV